MTWKPEGYPSLSPYLMVRDAEAVLGFAEAVFGGTRLQVIPSAQGGILHAEMRLDDSVVMMGEVKQAGDAHVHLYLPDVEAAFDRAVAAGGTVVQPLTDKGDGDMRGGVSDGHGCTWWMARHID